PVHVIAVSIGHGGDDPIIATTLQAKKQIRNPSHHFTNAESAHGVSPLNDVQRLSASIGTETKTRKNTDHFRTSAEGLHKNAFMLRCPRMIRHRCNGRAGLVSSWRGLAVIWLVRRDSIERDRRSRPSKSQERAVFRVRAVLRPKAPR